MSDDRIDVRRVRFGDSEDVLLAAIHYYDRRNSSKEKQYEAMGAHLDTLIAAELKAEHHRTIVFGDFNMNPFDLGMTSRLNGLGAMMTRELTVAHSHDPDRLVFYNPMWALMGKAEAPGTHYWDGDDPHNCYWHCLDGILVRPDLFDAFRDEDLRIIRRLNTRGGEEVDLIRRAGKHWRLAYSDHLPIVFKVTPAKAPTPGT